MTTSAENPQDRFEMAWTALDERLTSDAKNLRDMAETVASETDKNRLLDKATGADYAISLWHDLNDGALRRSGDYAGMWRTFTDHIATRMRADGFQPGYYQGLDLAVSYQRGYGPDVDAPRLTPRG